MTLAFLPYNQQMRKFIVALVLLLAVYFLITRLSEMELIALTFRRGDWRFLILALLVQTAWFFNVGASFRAVYSLIGIQENRLRLTQLAAAAVFLNVVAPAGGMSGIAVFIADAHRRRYPPGKAAIAGALYILFDYAGFLCVLALGLIVLFRRNSLNWPEITATAILLFIAIGLSSLLYLAMRGANQLAVVLTWFTRQINKILHPFIRRNYLSEERARSFAHDAAAGIRSLPRKPESFLMPFALALSSKALMISVLFLVFLAFKIPFSIGTLIASFSIGYLFVIVSPTPSGLGVVEGALTLALRGMWVPLEEAAVVVLAYRGFTFWLPLLVGAFAFRHITNGRDPHVKEIQNGGIN